MTIDGHSVITGSFNWTQKAVTCNKENLVIIYDPPTTVKFIENFEILWNEFITLRGILYIDHKLVKARRKF
jgi:phosphatidylserine/phosphatidylglycerophosphate/cardiolipin synthase-like enzyme